MRLAVETPSEFAGAVLTTIMQRRGTVIGQQEVGGMTITESEVPLAEMFGYSTTLRSATQGKADFTMEFSRYLAGTGVGARRARGGQDREAGQGELVTQATDGNWDHTR